MHPPPDSTSTQEAKPDWLKNWKPIANTEVTVNTGPGRDRWVPGMSSPNPKGRPRGISERKAKITERLLDQAGAVMDVMLQKALEGDSAAAALVVNRVLPSVKAQLEKVTFTLNVDASISKQVEQVLSAIANGEIAPDVGKKIIEAIQALGNVRAVEELEQRIIMLEEKER